MTTCSLAVILPACAGLYFSTPAQASDFHGKNGSVILRMCKSADKVKTLSVMCHSYLDGYLDAMHHTGKSKSAFCLEDSDRRKAPVALVAWIEAHPESLPRPAAEVLQRALTERFPCKGVK